MMSLVPRLTAFNTPPVPVSSTQGSTPFFHVVISSTKQKKCSSSSFSFSEQFNPRYCIRASTSNGEDHNISDTQNSATDHDGSKENDGSHQVKTSASSELMMKLRRYGISGILSYGLLNTLYYLTTFLLVWFFVAPAPGRMGYSAAVERFLKIMAMVWAGSQVTKLLRVGGALAVAPFVDSGLSWFTTKFGFETQGKAFMAIVGFCFGMAVLLFLVVTLLWA